MRSYCLIAPAKINLYLEIIGSRPDGFHELVMLLQSIELSDRVYLHANGIDDIRIHCQHPEVPSQPTNLAYKAAKLMADQFPDIFANYGGMEITIDKRIPVAAGLAGGSTDAAAVLVGINLMWQLGLTQPELQELAALLGSDVPFCISGGTAIATGRGEQLDAINSPPSLFVVLAKYRNISVSTAWAYQTYRQKFGHEYIIDPDVIRSRIIEIHSSPLVNAISHKHSAKIGQLLHNDLERVVLPAYPQVEQLRNAFADAGVLGTMMSGSGPTVFALCESETHAQEVKRKVRSVIPDFELKFWITRLSSAGISVT
ncbi:4-(cytidine 5'-diphospho)-2-C-methyl-D-erythritol kinase [Oscillatoria salina]|uniref:4-(cytidine 5'-diphospho)-2-C-methyl-D-erythritol kinase n=1 Tax=Oscillatoria salina TaxID=331517 RepID=UPI0013BBF183|nr:4-(cytidine 5'-diphospho)-2-C-methyl-D-erythritol kinase [Oscillatoria salina]MBZ8182476.1 4-(cytidine 5'-diphospho)-2-C-methyl-D-erythritol kinase [Oscillatoria salina IIICB1]NET90000.1 4-(cytidine 5'-diphospho)-2-C-methyl-D-erythritol kinase [Kamptonema sp. SIO1D9]